jgi:hypothetical protein
MGCEGGSIAGRQDVVKVKAKAVVETDPRQAQRERLSTCALTHHPLQSPCVIDQLGALYNKDAIIQHLLSSRPQQPTAATAASASSSRALPHIQRLRDVVEAKMSFATQSAGDRLLVCPVAGAGGTGHHRFVCMRCCGVVLSEQAMREVGKERCLGCGVELQRREEVGSEYDLWIPVCPAQEEREALQRRLQLQTRRTREDRPRKSRQPQQTDSRQPEPHATSATSPPSATSASTSSPLPAPLPADSLPSFVAPRCNAADKRHREDAAEELVSSKRREAEVDTTPDASQHLPAHCALPAAVVTS